MKKSFGSKLFDLCNGFLMILLCLTIIVPFWQQIVISLSKPAEASSVGWHLFTMDATFDAYRQIFLVGSIGDAYLWTILRSVLGTLLTVVVSAMMAYALSKKELLWRGFFMKLVLLTMFFGGGMVPTFLLIKDLHMLDTIWSLVLPGMCSAFNIVIIRNFFTALPVEIEEAAHIDGANDLQVFFHIIVRLSTPILATVTLWSMVGHWNSWFDAMIYITGGHIKVLQIVLRDVINNASSAALTAFGGQDFNMDMQNYTAESVKAAILMATTLPIVMVYPFLQRYFVKGIMIGSVKG